MRVFLIGLVCFVSLVVLVGCLGEGEDPEVNPAETVQKEISREAAIRYCQEIQHTHYLRSGCYQTYRDAEWLGDALQFCVYYVNTYVSNRCLSAYVPSVFWQTRRGLAYDTTPPYDPPHWYGDKFNWFCLGGWPVKTVPNDTDALTQAWMDCEM